MSTSIYAGKSEFHPEHGSILGPVLDFDTWNQTVLAPDADARSDRGEDPFIANPRYIPDAGMNVANGNAYFIQDELGIQSEDGFARITIQDAQDRIQAAKARGDTIGGYLPRLERLVAKGIEHDATMLVFA